MITRIDHIGIAVKSIETMRELYENVLGMKITETEIVEDQKVKVAFLPIGDSEIELLESTADDGPIAKFIESRGEGIQHIAFRVDDIAAKLAELKAKGIRLIDETPRKGAGGARIAFLHPKATNGTLIELCERGGDI
ncbi:MAG TPA: methylmalonyl-CoA epimerase [Verrucomicrobiae bacterium]|nr:methylmalonyl-CoA epimerase [Verrucomicrobiae bacterium]